MKPSYHRVITFHYFCSRSSPDLSMFDGLGFGGGGGGIFGPVCGPGGCH
jgi:hypothetical protein